MSFLPGPDIITPTFKMDDSIADALAALEFLEDESEDDANDFDQPFSGNASPVLTRLQGFRRISQPPGIKFFPPSDAMLEAGRNGPTQDAGSLLLSLPVKLLQTILALLLDPNDSRSAAALNCTCKWIYRATLPGLWNSVVWRYPGKSTAFMKTYQWRNLTRREGFKYSRYVSSSVCKRALPNGHADFDLATMT